MLEGQFVDYAFKFENLRYYAVSPTSNFSSTQGGDPVYRYALKQSDYPTLIITDAIKDIEGNILQPGHYELALSDMHDFFILLQSKIPVATLPVFKIEEDTQAPKIEESKKYKKIKKKIEKERTRTNKKRQEAGMPPDEDKIYMEASIEYVADGDYFLVKYERGNIRAWGAIKSY